METCALCGDPIRIGEKCGFQIVGYEYERIQGGTNVIHLRRRTGNVAHKTCIEQGKREVPGQMRLA
jgi:hypothetical protein